MKQYLCEKTKELVTAVEFTGSEHSYRKIKKLLGADNPFTFDKEDKVIHDGKRSYKKGTFVILGKSGWLAMGFVAFVKGYDEVEKGKSNEKPVKEQTKVKLGKEHAGCFNCKVKHLTPKLLLGRLCWKDLFISLVPGKAKYALLKFENGKLNQLGKAANISNVEKEKDFYLIERSEVLNGQERE